MMQGMQSQVPQELSALMALQQGMQTGQVAAKTPDGSNDTIAAKTINAAQQQMMPPPQMPPQMSAPGVMDVAQQAGIAGQIQAMQQEQAQQQLMEAMQQQQQPQMMAAGGVAGLHSNIRGFAPGGIVGYDGQDGSFAIDPGSPGGGASNSVRSTARISPYIENVLKLDPDMDEQGMPRTRRESEMIRARQAEALAQIKKAEDYAVSLSLPPPEYIKRMEDFYRPRSSAAAPSAAQGATSATASSAPLDGTRIPPEVQAERDSGRLAILQKELVQAQARLATGDPRAQSDIEAISREIQRTASGPVAGTSPRVPQIGAGNIPIARVGLGALPAAQRDEMGPPVPSEAERQFGEAFAARQRSAPKQISPADMGRQATEYAKAEREFLISQGRDPDFMDKAAAEIARLAGERGGYYDQQAKEILEKQQRRGLATYLMGARGSRLGETLAAGAGAANRAEEAALMQSREFTEKRFKVQEAAAKERLLLDKARDEIARGQFDKARKTMEEYEKARQEHERGNASLRAEYAKYLGGEAGKAENRLIEQARLEAQQRGQDLQYLAAAQRSEASGANDPRRIYDTINDNVQKRMDTWSKSLEGIRASKDPNAMANKRREFLRDALSEAIAIGTKIPPEVVEALTKGATPGAAPGVDYSQYKVTKE